ncbi:unnamed protein product [Clonostachys rosea]|uniref:Uncharacterized protein n=1 Tax=Bionectria ochroleuca TaxID=29856 RepID=A0ABY6V1X7_BIOOC|nr:unnamed protein product [Clonostachys rosea]
MMRLQRWQSIVLQASTLAVLGYIISHEIDRSHSKDESFWDDPVLKNYTTTLERLSKSRNSTSTPSFFYNETLANGTINDLPKLNPKKGQAAPNFYMVTLPQNIIAQVIIIFLSYYWNLALEGLLPARPAVVVTRNEKEDIIEDESREEEIVRRWVLKGRVQRSSISWLNTFLKWVIDMTLGATWISILHVVIFGLCFKSSKVKGMSDFFWSLCLEEF